MKKIDKRVWWSLPILLGGYLIYRQFAKSNQPIVDPLAQVEPLIKSTPSPSPSYSSNYPLKKGSRDAGSPQNPNGLVVEIQQLINAYGGYKPKIGAYVSLPLKLTEDGVYGSNTEWAIEQYIGKKTIDSRQDTINLEQKMIEKQQKEDFLKIPRF
jgi:peptidoglycan hydrolase-like protein with peptidoglycan-binding domain